MQKLLFLLSISLLLVSVSFAQPASDRQRIENERKAIQQELKAIQSTYNKVKGQRKETIGQLTVLQRKVEIQDRYIGNISKELRVISDDIYLSTLEVNRLNRQLDTLKAQYARSVIYAYKTRSTYDYLNFIFSSDNFNDALKRISYLRTYRQYRQQQVQNIQETQKAIEDRKNQLLSKKTQKNSVLQNQTLQLKELEEQKKEKDAVANKLRAQEKELSKQIAAKKKRDNQLKSQIAAIVRREIDAAKKAEANRIAAEKRAAAAAPKDNAATTTTTTAKKPARKSSDSYLTLNETQRALAASFERNRGSLPWPVDNGYISLPFGTSRVGGLSFDNPGISISTPSSGSSVKSVFDGEVSAVSNTGDGMMVMIKHGKYFSVYSNLSSANVSKGSSVKTGQVIGRTAEADDGTGGQLDFMIMQEYKNVNPTPWLNRR